MLVAACDPMLCPNWGLQVFFTKLGLTSENVLRHPDGSLVPSLAVVYHKVFAQSELAPGWEAYQGMRLLFDPFARVRWPRRFYYYFIF